MSVCFSILVVALNPGEKLKKTVDSIFGQDYERVEVIVKDGLSEDGSIEALEKERAGEERLRIVRSRDHGIYDAMNQAVALARGDYVLFLNCGDSFAEPWVLQRAAQRIREERGEAQEGRGEACEKMEEACEKMEEAPADAAGIPRVYYGDTFCERTGDLVHAASRITGFTCYRNIPCHQSCFYDRRLFAKRQYLEEYRIRADYEHFLWCYYRAGAEMIYLDMAVSAYEGGGYSEDEANRRRDREEHRKITSLYMKRGELLRYRLAMALTLAPLRSYLAGDPRFSKIYNGLKDGLTGRRKSGA